MRERADSDRADKDRDDSDRADKDRDDSDRADKDRDDSDRADSDRELIVKDRDDRSWSRGVIERALNAPDAVLSSNAADITSSHTLLDTLMTNFSPFPG